MIRSKKTKIVSVFLSLCMVGSMFSSIPLTASATTPTLAATPIYSCTGATVNTTDYAVPAGSTDPTSPKQVVIMYDSKTTQTPVGALMPGNSTTRFEFYNWKVTNTDTGAGTFGIQLATPAYFGALISSTYGPNGDPLDPATGKVFAENSSNIYYIKVVDTTDTNKYSYYKFVFVRAANNVSNIKASSDSNIVSETATLNGSAIPFPVQSNAKDFTTDPKTVPTITFTMKVGTTCVPADLVTDSTHDSSITKSDGSALDTSITGTSNSPYQIKVTAEDGTATVYNVVVAVLSDENRFTVNPTAVSNSGLANYTSTDFTDIQGSTEANPKSVIYALQDGLYAINNVRSNMFTKHDSNSTLECWTDGFDGKVSFNDYVGTINTGDQFKVYVKETSTSGNVAYTVITFAVLTKNTLYMNGLQHATASTLSAIGGIDSAHATAISVAIDPNAPNGTVDLSGLSGIGTIAVYSDKDCAEAHKIADKKVQILPTDKPKTVYVTFTDSSTSATTYFVFTITRAKSSVVVLQDNGNTGYTIKDVNGKTITTDGFIGSTDSNKPTVVNLIYDASTLAQTGLNSALKYMNPTGVATVNYLPVNNPFVTSQSVDYVVNSTAIAEDGTQAYFKVILHVADGAKANITSIGIDGAVIATLPAAGSLDPTNPTAISFILPTSITKLVQGNLWSKDNAKVTLYTNSDYSQIVDDKHLANLSGRVYVKSESKNQVGTDPNKTPAVTNYYVATFNSINVKNAAIISFNVTNAIVNTIPTASYDATKPAVITAIVPKATTAITSANFNVADSGSISLYTANDFATPVASVPVSGTAAKAFVKVTSFDGTVSSYYEVDMQLADINNAALTAINKGTVNGTIPVGSPEKLYAPEINVTIDNTVTSISASDFTAPDLGNVTLYSDSAFSTAKDSIDVTGNVATAYVAVTSVNNAVVKYYKVNFNVVDTDPTHAGSMYTAKDNGFTPSGSMFNATVTVDRNKAAQLTAPKLLIKINYKDSNPVYLTTNLVGSTAGITVDKTVVSVQYAVIDGTPDFSKGPAILQSNWVTLAVPQA